MMPIDFLSIAQQCAPNVAPETLRAIVQTESAFNPYAIGIVGGHLSRQPQTRNEALATVRGLEAAGWNYSVGLSQVNRSNFSTYGLDAVAAFDPCTNLRAGARILQRCYRRASAKMGAGQNALHAALSCYYSGNFARGFKADVRDTNYVQRVVASATQNDGSSTHDTAIPVIVDDAHAIPTAGAHAIPLTRSGLKSAVGATAGDGSPAAARFEPSHAAWDTFGDF